MDKSFQTLASALLALNASFAFGGLFITGELFRTLSDHFTIEDAPIADMLSTAFTIVISTGVITAVFGLIDSKIVDITLVSIGMILYTCACLVIGWEIPSWSVYYVYIITMFAIGIGLAFWGSLLVIVKHKLSSILVFVPLFGLLGTTSLQLTDSDHFNMPYRTLGTFSLMSLVFTIVLLIALFQSKDNNMYEKETLESKSTMNTMKWIHFALFLTAKMLLTPVFMTSTLFWPNYIMRIQGVNDTGGFEEFEVGLEDRVVRDTLLWMYAGGVLGFLMMQFSPWKTVTKVFNHLVGLSSLIGWFVRSQNTVIQPIVILDLCALSFFIGLSLHAIFFDAFVQVACWCNSIKPSIKLMIVLLGSIVVNSCVRFSTGYFGTLPDRIEWPFVVMINLCLFSVTILLEIMGIIIEFMFNQDKETKKTRDE